MMDRLTIARLVDRAIQNDQAAIKALYQETYPAAFAFTCHLCRNHDDAEDILQESYISAFARLDRLKNKARFWGWLRGIILNKWRDYCRELSGTYDVAVYEISSADNMEYWQLDASVQAMVEDQELNQRIREIVGSLPEKQRVCALWYYYEDMSMDEIAEKLQIPLGSVKSRLYYARKKIEKALKEEHLYAVEPLSSSVGTGMLARILAALPQAAASLPAAQGVTAAGLAVRIGVGLVSVAAAAGVAGMTMMHVRDSSSRHVDVTKVTSSASSATFTTTVTTTAATTATTATTTAATAVTTVPRKTVSFDCRPVEGGVCIARYTGNADHVVIPSEVDGQRVVAVDNSAFQNCRFLQSVSIPDSVTTIGVDAFRECDSLSDVSFGAGVSSIGDMAFVGCDSLSNVHLPANVRSVGIYAFAYCSSLSRVSVSQGTETIGYNAFAFCPCLRSVTLPPSVTAIGGNAFEGCSSELVLHVPEGSYSHQYAEESVIIYRFE